MQPDELLSRDQVEQQYGLSRRWLELAAVRGDGPIMVRISRRMIRYRRSDVVAWISSRTVRSTADQTEPPNFDRCAPDSARGAGMSSSGSAA